MPGCRPTLIWVKLVKIGTLPSPAASELLSLSLLIFLFLSFPRICVHHFVSYAYAYWIFRWKAPRAEIPDGTFAFSLRLDK